MSTINEKFNDYLDKNWLIHSSIILQHRDWLFNSVDTTEIFKQYSLFKRDAVALINKNIKEKDSSLKIINSKARYLNAIKDEKTRITVYSILKMFQKYVSYETASWFWNTFKGFLSYQNKNKVKMDCDIMTMVADDISSAVWVNQDMFDVMNVDGVVNHANWIFEMSEWKSWEVDWTIIERTNFNSRWIPATTQKWFIHTSKNMLIYSLLGQYTIKWEKYIKSIKQIEREFFKFSINENHNPYILLLWLQQRFSSDIRSAVSTEKKPNTFKFYVRLWKIIQQLRKSWKISNITLKKVEESFRDLLNVFGEIDLYSWEQVDHLFSYIQ